jgi:hypothetical protein
MIEGIAPPFGGASPLTAVIFLVATFLGKPEEDASDAEVDALLVLIFEDFVTLGVFQG